MLVLTVRTTGDLEVSDIDGDHLPFLQGRVGGTIDCIATDKFDMWVNDEGMIIDSFLPNFPATCLLWMIEPMWYSMHQVIYGDVVFSGCADADGNMTGLSEQFIEQMFRMMRVQE